jgi:hypothetical protein
MPDCGKRCLAGVSVVSRNANRAKCRRMANEFSSGSRAATTTCSVRVALRRAPRLGKGVFANAVIGRFCRSAPSRRTVLRRVRMSLIDPVEPFALQAREHGLRCDTSRRPHRTACTVQRTRVSRTMFFTSILSNHFWSRKWASNAPNSVLNASGETSVSPCADSDCRIDAVRKQGHPTALRMFDPYRPTVNPLHRSSSTNAASERSVLRWQKRVGRGSSMFDGPVVCLNMVRKTK